MLSESLFSIPDIMFWILLILPAYAEIHYTLKGFSLVSRKRPEILADAPWRIDPGETLPLFIFVKDADRFPVEIKSILAIIHYQDGETEEHHLPGTPVEIGTAWWHRIYEIAPAASKTGEIRCSVRFEVYYPNSGKTRRFENDNLWSSSHAPLTIALGAGRLPAFKHWVHGDLHYHSSLTSDQVEYGAPLEAAAKMARALGMGFMAVTDHSYDLDDREDNYLINDPELPKWKRLHREILTAEAASGVVILPGEEVSCGNCRGENVHLLLLNNRQYFPGAGDSNERWFQNRPDMRIPEILDQIDTDTLAFGAHPGVPFAPLQRILLRRGIWHPADARHGRMNGMQFYNGSTDWSFRRGYRNWIRQLLAGHRLSLVAGNDAHGNFNRNRKLGQPFLYISENGIHTFGRGRTVAFLPDGLSGKNLADSLKKGRTCISTGPVLDLQVTNGAGRTAMIGDTLSGDRFTIRIRGRSSEEFGHLKKCVLYLGNQKIRRETRLKRIAQFDNTLDFDLSIPLDIGVSVYLRAELYTQKGSLRFFCMTSPVWLEPA